MFCKFIFIPFSLYAIPPVCNKVDGFSVELSATGHVWAENKILETSCVYVCGVLDYMCFDINQQYKW